MSEGKDVAIIMGSDSDWPVMEEAAKALDSFGISYTADVVSAHRMPEEMVDFAKSAVSKGYKVIIAGAGGSSVRAGSLARSFPIAHCLLPQFPPPSASWPGAGLA